MEKIHDDSWVYGKYSTGSGSILIDDSTEDLFNIDSIKAYEDEIKKNLYKMKVSINSLKDMYILNIGTGREAIAFSNLGAKKVTHFDYSFLNVERMKKFIQKNNLKNIIETKNVDIVDYKLPPLSFDLVYTHGVVQHFSHPGKGLKNLINSMKKNGLIWLYFYRSGTFQHFCFEMIRDLIQDTKNPEVYYLSMSLINCEKKDSNLFISGFMDNCFPGHANLYTPDTYISFVKECGLKIISSSKLDPINTSIDHRFAHPSTIITCRRESVEDLRVDIDVLSKNQSINQLNEDYYRDYVYFKTIVELIRQYKRVKRLLYQKRNNSTIVFALAYKIYSIERESYFNYLSNNEYNLNKYYSMLRETLNDLEKNVNNYGSGQMN